MSHEAWRKHLTDYNEGLGVVYERFMLNDLLLGLKRRYGIADVLEAPIYGMAGVSGINSVALARQGCRVTLVDNNAERLVGVRRIWDELELPHTAHQQDDLSHLPFADRSFDLAWNFAALWYVPEAGALLNELVRVSRKLVLISVPNRVQMGYFLRKHFIDKDFFTQVDERWADIRHVKRALRVAGVKLVGEGVLDVPPWPDTCMPAAEFLRRLGIRSRKLEGRFQGQGWEWSTMAYYLGQQPELKARVERYAFLDRAPLPWPVKAVWAHHRYVIGEKRD